MTEAISRAQMNGWGYYEWCYRENLQSNGGWLDDQEVEDKKSEIPAAMWLSEYEGQEPNPEGRIFDEETLSGLFLRELGVFEGAEGEEIIVPGTMMGDGHDYYHGTDWAKSSDWTVIHSMKRRRGGPDRLVAWMRLGRRKWPDMVAKHDERVERFGGKSAHDVTGIGSVVEDYMLTDSEPVDFRNKKRRDKLLNRYVGKCQALEYEFPYIKFMYEEHKYLTVDMLYGNDHTPDSVVAGALAEEANSKRSGRLLIARI
jgi:hypothetical protein